MTKEKKMNNQLVLYRPKTKEFERDDNNIPFKEWQRKRAQKEKIKRESSVEYWRERCRYQKGKIDEQYNTIFELCGEHNEMVVKIEKLEKENQELELKIKDKEKCYEGDPLPIEVLNYFLVKKEDKKKKGVKDVK